jgi:hypothetical protein
MSHASPIPDATLALFRSELKKLEAREQALKAELNSVQQGIKLLAKVFKGVNENEL